MVYNIFDPVFLNKNLYHEKPVLSYLHRVCMNIYIYTHIRHLCKYMYTCKHKNSGKLLCK